MANYYKPVKINKKRGAISGVVFDSKGDEINEQDRGLDGNCQTDGKQHDWLLLPMQETDSKQYLVCLKCFEHSHL